MIDTVYVSVNDSSELHQCSSSKQNIVYAIFVEYQFVFSEYHFVEFSSLGKMSTRYISELYILHNK